MCHKIYIINEQKRGNKMNKLTYYTDLKMAKFTGTSGTGEECVNEEAHNISLEDAKTFWGSDIECDIQIID